MNKVYMLFCLVLCQYGIFAQKEVSSRPPNIVLIMVDDLRTQLKCYGEESMVTPHMDRLALKGQLFERAYIGYPSCGPSRATLLSGVYPSRDRFLEWYSTLDSELPGVTSLPMHFRNNNYQTFAYGKVLHNVQDSKLSWDETWRPVSASSEPIGEYLNPESIKKFAAINTHRHTDTKDRSEINLPKHGPAYEAAEVLPDAYKDGKVTAKAIEKLEHLSRNRNQPFFMAVGFYKPHSPFNAPKRFWDLYDRNKITLPTNSQFPENIPETFKKDLGGVRGYHGIPKEGPIPDSLAKTLLHGYYASVSYIDDQIGRLINHLETLGFAQNTIIVLWGDHGHQLGENGMWDKARIYQNSIRVPLIVVLPNQKGGVRHKQLVESVDVYPTLCELANVKVPFHTQGKSFAPLLRGHNNITKEHVFVRSLLNTETVVSDRYSYSEVLSSKQKLQNRVLFDLLKDPKEQNNVVDQTGYKQVVDSLSKVLNTHIIERDLIRFGKKK